MDFFKPVDVYPIVNSLVHQITGQDNLTVVDTASFIDAGKKIIQVGDTTSYDQIFGALSVNIGRTIIDVDEYEGHFKLIDSTSSEYDAKVRKISFYAKDTQASGMFNTQLFTSLGSGLDDESGPGSQWEQSPKIPLERVYSSEAVYDYEATMYINQLKDAFTSEQSFLDYINGMRVDIMNDMESQTEARNQALVLSRLAGNKLMTDKGLIGPECAVNLTAEYNKTYNTTYTTSDLLNDHKVAFLEFFLARIKNDSDLMTYRSTLFHDDCAQTINGQKYVILRASKKSRQRFIYNARLFTQINLALAQIFHPDKLLLPENGEGVQYWQSITDPYKIDIIPPLPDGETSSEVKIDTVVGMLFDDRCLYSNNRYTGMLPTGINARHGYRNEFYHFKYSQNNDYTHPSVLYYMSDDTTEYFTGDGTKVKFTLGAEPTSIVSVTVNGVAKEVTTDYTVSGADVTFTSAPADDAVIQIIYK